MANKDDLNPVIDDLENQAKTVPSGDAPPAQPDKGWPNTLTTDEQKLHAYKSVLGGFTQVSQKNKTLQDQVNQMQQRITEFEERANLGGTTPNLGGLDPTGDYHPPATETEFDPYNPQAVQGMVAQTVATMRIAEVLEEENQANPTEFMERYGYVKMLGQQYPNLARTAAGIKKLFQEADKRRKDNTRTQAFRALGLILGREPSEEDIQKFRESFPGAQTQPQGGELQAPNAGYMPDSTGSSRTGADTNTQPDLDRQIEEAKQKGDHQEVTRLLMQKALLR